MHYYPDMHNGMFPWMYYASLPFLILVVWIVFRKSDFRKELLFGSAFFVGAICIMPQLVSVGPALTPERYSYIPYIGFFYAIGQCINRYGTDKWRVPLYSGFAALLLVFCVISWKRVEVWSNSETLLSDVLEKNKDVADCSFFYWLRGNARIQDGNVKEAIEDYTTALQQFPGYSEAYANRGSAYFQAGDFGAAIRDYDKAIRIKPGNARNYYNRAAGKASTGDFPGALDDYNRFLQMQPNDATAYADRGMVRVSMKDTAGACMDWRKSAQLGNETAAQIAAQVCGQ
jgi:tetratricopeptide (TPR) repeat protein